MILALESSCDETAVAVFNPAKGIAGEWIHTQVALHEKHGGVVPDLATREHLRHFTPLLEMAKQQTNFADLRQIAVTRGPGLAACLAVGVATAKSLALALDLPVVGVNHLRAHAFSPFIALHAQDPDDFLREWGRLLPHLSLIVSGGNTLLCTIGRDRQIRVIATTRDDAAGEALDKGAKLLGLGYPGGPMVERQARGGNPAAYDFPRGIERRDALDFSFSGLKTSLRYQLEKMTENEVKTRMADLCASYQQAVVDALIRKLGFAFERQACASIGLSGGVANNQRLRAATEKWAKEKRAAFFAAEPRHTGDNAAMIAFAAWIDATGVDAGSGMALSIDPNAPPENPEHAVAQE